MDITGIIYNWQTQCLLFGNSDYFERRWLLEDLYNLHLFSLLTFYTDFVTMGPYEKDLWHLILLRLVEDRRWTCIHFLQYT